MYKISTYLNSDKIYLETNWIIYAHNIYKKTINYYMVLHGF